MPQALLMSPRWPGAVPQALLMSHAWGGAPGFINVAPLGLFSLSLAGLKQAGVQTLVW